MNPDDRNARMLKRMEVDVRRFQENHNRLQTLKYISIKYGYTMQAGITFLNTL